MSFTYLPWYTSPCPSDRSIETASLSIIQLPIDSQVKLVVLKKRMGVEQVTPLTILMAIGFFDVAFTSPVFYNRFAGVHIKQARYFFMWFK